MRILDVCYDNQSFDELLARMLALHASRQPAVVTYLNIDCLQQASRAPDYARLLEQADLVIPDGIGIKLATELQGVRKAEHFIGTDLYLQALTRLSQQGARFYFLGSEEGIAAKAAARMQQKNPEFVLAGCHHGFFSDDAAIIKDINDSGADVLVVGMGVPKQEFWLAAHHRELAPPLRLAVGALFNWESGVYARAPGWMRWANLEWLWRAAQEPGRLFSRYFLRDLPFLASLALHRLKGPLGSGKPSTPKGTFLSDHMQLLGVRYDNLTFNHAVTKALSLYRAPRPALVSYLNIDCLRLAQKHADYRAALQSADVVLPDGIGIGIATRMGGGQKAEHWIVTDVFIALIEQLARQKAKFFFLGGPPDVAQAAADKLRARLPDIVIAGCAHGYFQDDAQMVETINASGADVLIVGLGAPRQERWLLRHQAALQPQLRLAVGALLTWISGAQPRAPQWVQTLHLEWFWRVLQEPRRLFRRYFLEDLPFLLSLPFRGIKAEAGPPKTP